MFLFAQSINRKAKCAVIISLREGYYYQWRHQPPFDAFASNVYHVTAPPYKEVIYKRINYALKNIKVDGKTSGLFGKGVQIELNNRSVKDFLESVKKSLFGSDNSEMLSFLEETTYPNIREGLEIFKHFLLSGHTSVATYILRQQFTSNKDNIPIPIWEFIKAVSLDNKKYYNHEISRIHNLFFPVKNSSNHFLKIKILKYLYSRVEQLAYTEKFLPKEQVINIFLEAGYKSDILKDELNELLTFRLIETDDNISDKEDSNILKINQNISISLKGSYYINVLLCKFVYVDLMLQDTPIFDEKFYNKIRQSFPIVNSKGKQNLKDRIVTCEAFIEYLKLQEEKETVESDKISNNIIRDMMNNGLAYDIGRVKNAQQKLS